MHTGAIEKIKNKHYANTLMSVDCSAHHSVCLPIFILSIKCSAINFELIVLCLIKSAAPHT